MSIFSHIWSFAGYLVPFIFVLGLVVFFHELGHYLVGRWCGVKVDAFSMGIGPEIFAYTTKNGERWRIAALPLGDYVKFHGDANATSTTPDAAVASMPQSERDVTFGGQSVGKRAAIVVAGPLANFALAIVIFAGIFYTYGRHIIVPRVIAVQENSAAAVAGFKAGDLIVAVNGKEIESFSDMQRIVSTHADVAVVFKVQRETGVQDLTATPRMRELKGPFGRFRIGVLGVEASNQGANAYEKSYGVIDSTRLAVDETIFVLERTAAYIGGLFLGNESVDQLSGPIGTAAVAGEMAKISFGALLNLAAILSISIGILNLLPVPMLDGGHLMYYAYEAIRGRALSERLQEYGFRLGLSLVICLMVFATYNDVARFGPVMLNWITSLWI